MSTQELWGINTLNAPVLFITSQTTGRWNVTCLVRMEPELVREARHSQAHLNAVNPGEEVIFIQSGLHSEKAACWWYVGVSFYQWIQGDAWSIHKGCMDELNDGLMDGFPNKAQKFQTKPQSKLEYIRKGMELGQRRTHWGCFWCAKVSTMKYS